MSSIDSSSAPSWRNTSVLRLAGRSDPVEVATRLAREAVFGALEAGWEGPPFDPMKLADFMGIVLRASGAVRDARLVCEKERAVIEYNPARPRARVRYSIAHECAHTLFPDWNEVPRHRLASADMVADDWELESLCNLIAAEFLMPLGSLPHVLDGASSLEELLVARREFDVSVEALFRRVVALSETPCAMFVARPTSKGYALEYAIPSRNWSPSFRKGQLVPTDSVIPTCVGIGHTVKAIETWPGGQAGTRIEAVGVPGHPGSSLPRVVVWCRNTEQPDSEGRRIEYLYGDATHPHSRGESILVHVVPDDTRVWGGGGFAASLRRAYGNVQADFIEWRATFPGRVPLGEVRFARATDSLVVTSIVAQAGHGPAPRPRIRYAALQRGLDAVARAAAEQGATLHMPRIGTGMAGGRWEVIEDILTESLQRFDVSAFVYDLPSRAGAVPGAARK